MYEFEVHFLATGETGFLYGYSIRDLAHRYPKLDPNSYVIVCREYID